MDFRELVKANRSYRRFYEDAAISRETMMKLIDTARLTACGGNRQALKYYISCDSATNEKIFPHVVWAAYLADWGGPKSGERPTAYIVLVQDEGYKMAGTVDHGIAAQTILLAATEIGLGGCMMTNIKKDELRAAIALPQNYEILMVIALGKPKEKVVIDEIEPAADIKYWREADQTHHVPKKKLKDIIIN